MLRCDFRVGDIPTKDNNARVARSIPGYDSLSENRHELWWSCRFFSCEIARDSDEGQQIEKLVNNGATYKKMERQMLAIAIKHMSNSRLLKLMTDIMKSSYNDGREYQAKVISDAVGYKQN